MGKAVGQAVSTTNPVHRVSVFETRDMNPERTLIVCDCGWTADVPAAGHPDSLSAAAAAYQEHATP